MSFYHDSLVVDIESMQEKSNDDSEKKARDARLIIFGNNCRKFREKTGFSQENFAHERDLPRTYYGDIERGKRNLTLESVFKIADALGVNPKELLEGIPNKEESSKGTDKK